MSMEKGGHYLGSRNAERNARTAPAVVEAGRTRRWPSPGTCGPCSAENRQQSQLWGGTSCVIWCHLTLRFAGFGSFRFSSCQHYARQCRLILEIPKLHLCMMQPQRIDRVKIPWASMHAFPKHRRPKQKNAGGPPLQAQRAAQRSRCRRSRRTRLGFHDSRSCRCPCVCQRSSSRPSALCARVHAAPHLAVQLGGPLQQAHGGGDAAAAAGAATAGRDRPCGSRGDRLPQPEVRDGGKAPAGGEQLLQELRLLRTQKQIA